MVLSSIWEGTLKSTWWMAIFFCIFSLLRSSFLFPSFFYLLLLLLYLPSSRRPHHLHRQCWHRFSPLPHLLPLPSSSLSPTSSLPSSSLSPSSSSSLLSFLYMSGARESSLKWARYAAEARLQGQLTIRSNVTFASSSDQTYFENRTFLFLIDPVILNAIFWNSSI